MSGLARNFGSGVRTLSDLKEVFDFDLDFDRLLLRDFLDDSEPRERLESRERVESRELLDRFDLARPVSFRPSFLMNLAGALETLELRLFI